MLVVNEVKIIIFNEHSPIKDIQYLKFRLMTEWGCMSVAATCCKHEPCEQPRRKKRRTSYYYSNLLAAEDATNKVMASFGYYHKIDWSNDTKNSKAIFANKDNRSITVFLWNCHPDRNWHPFDLWIDYIKVVSIPVHLITIGTFDKYVYCRIVDCTGTFTN